MTAARVAGMYLDGYELRACLYAVNYAREARRREGKTASATLDQLARAMSAIVSESPTPDDQNGAERDSELVGPRSHFLTVAEVAQRLNITERHVRRLAPQLAGHLTAGRWLIPADAVEEHELGAA